MKFTFLGTGTSQGVPVITCMCAVCISTDKRDNRTRTSLLIQSENTSVVIDTGPDFRHQLLRENVKDLDAVVFTHGHKDHVAGLDDIRPFNYMLGKTMDVYAEEMVQEILKKEFSYAFVGHDYPGAPQINLKTIDETPFQIGDIPFIPIRAIHKTLPVLGFRIHDFTYITDANFIADVELEKIKGSKVLVLNALRKEPHYSHFNLEQAIEIVCRTQPEKAYFTHISHHLGLYDVVMKELPGSMELAYDGLQIVM
ncbi:MAG TPA: MBL fold metallo-hydrolase [Chitinophagales bacterium]|jgi:phosphoribosyl 1,2-cyclic phosphate phosphodiesterase|nr:MBL fold metallo-hydrolase [Chitinophagales bacterium]MBP6154555.1 MBL fold metallo-hydrolase [Chitinophagales bacterium]HQV77768.1 MBL fold metallo-hydrolase [Chitinophagales bacterium]HQW78242.1 MBL fold metallo-hydrolase [Chitinophagales bacterium]HRB66541.1 MBL fold metallo-hydrolase [Chitinophagales bacterium]